jgi:hypothetical protein
LVCAELELWDSLGILSSGLPLIANAAAPAWRGGVVAFFALENRRLRASIHGHCRRQTNKQTKKGASNNEVRDTFLF